MIKVKKATTPTLNGHGHGTVYGHDHGHGHGHVHVLDYFPGNGLNAFSGVYQRHRKLLRVENQTIRDAQQMDGINMSSMESSLIRKTSQVGNAAAIFSAPRLVTLVFWRFKYLRLVNFFKSSSPQSVISVP